MYPYRYMDSFQKFLEDKLPDTSIFYSSLKDELLLERIIYMLIITGMCLK